MRSEADPAKVRSMHEKVLNSDLFDRKLRMFKVNASLESEGYEIGRSRAFPAGWLENESIWLHMEYKYLLELARKGLHTEYFAAARDALVFNLDPQTYGRSILENSSFICSSAYYDASKHGQGFYARLSGSTAEFIHIWLMMVVGATPFGVDASGALTLTFAPAIPGDYFTKDAERVPCVDQHGAPGTLDVPANAFAFKLLGQIPVLYTNRARVDTFAPNARVGQVSLFGHDGALLLKVRAHKDDQVLLNCSSKATVAVANSDAVTEALLRGRSGPSAANRLLPRAALADRGR